MNLTALMFSLIFLLGIFLVQIGWIFGVILIRVLTESLVFCFNLRINFIVFIFRIRVLFISIAVFKWAIFYMKGSRRTSVFFFTLFLFVFSIILLTLRERFIIIFLGWEGLGITSFLLIVFYQNWIRRKGGLLTLLTNRLGDRVLLISFSYWIIIPPVILFSHTRQSLILMFFILALTKRAQIPFISWLPAAIAAPTPVRALVHRSTLVTAGIWLLIKFNVKLLLIRELQLIIGWSTLIVASLAALKEVDAKKLVALSTLSQLGLLIIGLRIGGWLVCLFHLLMHAMAKANLFLVVGNLIHLRFSQQDIRKLSSIISRFRLFIIITISLLRLIGVIITSGFLSKDSILISYHSLTSSLFSLGILLSVVSLTARYCFKLLSLSIRPSYYNSLMHVEERIVSLIPSFFLRGLRLSLGLLFSLNFIFVTIWKTIIRSFYWILVLLGLILFNLLSSLIFLNKFFVDQLNLILNIRKIFIEVSKTTSFNMVESVLETSYLIIVWSLSKLILITLTPVFLTLILMFIGVLF